MAQAGSRSAIDEHTLLDLCPAVIFRQRTDFSFEFISPKIEEWSGFSPQTWIQRPNLLKEILVEADRPSVEACLAGLAKGECRGEMTFRIRNRRTGRLRHLLERRRASRDAHGRVTGYEGVWTDVSVEAMASQRLETAAWQAAFAQITSGAAHDLNNKLTGILSLSDLYMMQLEESHELHAGLATIKQTAQQASQLLQQLARLYQANPGPREHVDLNQVVRLATETLRRIISARVTIESVLNKDGLPVHVDAVRLQRLMISLVLKAAARMPRSGSVILSTSRVAGQNSGACLTIRDDAAGIPERAIGDEARLIPFLDVSDDMATRDQVRSFAAAHGGASEVEALPQGSSIRITLPESTFDEHTPAKPSRPWVLVAGEDSDVLRRLTSELESRGAATVRAVDPIENQLEPGRFAWDAVLIHAPAEKIPALLQPIEQQKVPVIIYLTDGDATALEPEVSERVDLLLPSDLPLERVVEKIGAQFE